jgi:M6 family metalloprotease-like protein
MADFCCTASRLREADFFCRKGTWWASSVLVLLILTGEVSGRVIGSRGQVQALVVFARFQDEGGDAAPTFATDLFDPDLAGSLTHFYREMSRRQFSLDGEVLPRLYGVSRTAANYLATEGSRVGKYGNFAREVLELIDEDMDLGQYDNDGPDGVPNSGDDDGFVDFIFINTRTAPQGFFIGGATGIAGLGLGSDFVSADRNPNGRAIRVRRDDHEDGAGGTLQRGHTFALAVGTMAHEFGHILGLPDLFDTDINSAGDDLDPAEDGAGIGYWGLMGNGARGWNDQGGPNPFSAWSLEQLGWLGVDNAALVVLEEDAEDIVFDDVNAGGLVYKLPLPDSKVYYLVEYRRRDHSYYERDLPGQGLLIWRINPARLNNNDEQDKWVDLVCADGLYRDAGFPQGQEDSPDIGRDNLDFWAHDEPYSSAHNGNLGDATDIYDGVVYADFSVISNPAAPSGIAVSRIRSEGDRIRADLLLNDPRRAGIAAAAEVWSDTIQVVGDILVQSGAQLTILPGTVVLFGPDQRGSGIDPQRSELIVQGVLWSGLSRGDLVVMRSAAARPQAGDWFGIRISASGQVNMDETLIEHAVDGLSGSSLLRSQDLQSVALRQIARDGIRIDEFAESITLSDVEVEGAGGLGALIAGQGVVRVFGSYFSDNSGGGLECLGGFIDCRENRFINNGLGQDGSGNLVLGELVTGSVVDNFMQGGVGIRCNRSGRVRITDNHLEQNRIGLVSFSAIPEIVSNTFTDNELVLRISGFGAPSKLELNRVENAVRLVESTVSGEVRATNNWWGRAEEDWIQERVSGAVAWRPFLNFDPIFPVGFKLSQNYPNPFNGSTVINYSVGINVPVVAGRSMMLVEVRTITGALVRRLVEQEAAPGFYSVVWDGRNEAGARAASGVYYYQLRVGPIAVLKRLVVLR